jgi:anti-sigma28 factor (negative regulator of flagellin synthesis)
MGVYVEIGAARAIEMRPFASIFLLNQALITESSVTTAVEAFVTLKVSHGLSIVISSAIPQTSDERGRGWVGDMRESSRSGNLAVLSLNNRDMVRWLRSHLDAVPELRAERICELRQAISENRFVISVERIAEAMLADEW